MKEPTPNTNDPKVVVAEHLETACTSSPPWLERHFRTLLVGMTLAGLGLRVAILLECVEQNPLTWTPILDAGVYWEWANEVAGGNLVGRTPFLSAPLYPYLLGGIRALGGGFLAVYVVQLVLHLLTAGWIGWIGRRRFGAGVGLLACGIFLSLTEPVFFSTRLLPGTVQLFLICLLWAQLLRVQCRPSYLGCALGGGILGLNCLANPAMMLLVVLLGVWVSLQGVRLRERVVYGGLFVLGASLVISPATLHNRLACGEFIPITAHGGITLRHGNSPESVGTYTTASQVSASRERMHKDARRVYREATGEQPSWHKVDRHFRDQAVDEWLAHPRWALKLACVKLHWFLAGRNYGDIYHPQAEIARGLSSRLVLAPLPTAWLMGPALVGVVLLLRHLKRYAPELLLLAMPLFVVVVFWYSPRYRFPAVPVLVVVGALAVQRGLRRTGRWYLSVAVLAALVTSIGSGAFNRAIGFDSLDSALGKLDLQLGFAYRDQGDLNQAVSHYAAGLEQDPDSAEAHNGLGVVLAESGRLVEAVACYAEALRIDPDFAEAHYHLANALMAQGKVEQAIAQYGEALRINSDFAEAHGAQANALAGLGKHHQAIPHYNEALRLEPVWPELHHNLGLVLAGQGELRSAIGHLRQALEQKPDYALAHNNLANALLAVGQVDEAIEHYREAVRLAPGLALVHRNLGWGLARQGRFTEAAKAFRQALSIEPQDANTLCDLGTMLMRQGKIEQAISAFRAALRIDPAHSGAHQQLEAALAVGRVSPATPCREGG
ncbi:MAG: tetratricopeptide repeat protein [Phycisphaerae bacterium]|nr:tetratricopeptide repeat protein [Phycisphaerae bacterium]